MEFFYLILPDRGMVCSDPMQFQINVIREFLVAWLFCQQISFCVTIVVRRDFFWFKISSKAGVPSHVRGLSEILGKWACYWSCLSNYQDENSLSPWFQYR